MLPWSATTSTGTSCPVPWKLLYWAFVNILWVFCPWEMDLKRLTLNNRYMNRPVMSGAGLYDPTSIMNADTLNKCQVSRCAIHFKFGYLLTWFLVEGGLDKACLLPVGLLLLLVRHDLQPHHRLEPQVQKISLWWYQVNVLYVRRQFLWLTYYNWQTHMKLMSRVWALILRDDCIIILIALKWLTILKVTNQPIFRASP